MVGQPAHGEEHQDVLWSAGQGAEPMLRGCNSKKALKFLENGVPLLLSAGGHTV